MSGPRKHGSSYHGEKFCRDCRSRLVPVYHYIRWGYDEMTGKRIYYKHKHMTCPKWGKDNAWWNFLYRASWDEHTKIEVSHDRITKPSKGVKIYNYGEDY